MSAGYDPWQKAMDDAEQMKCEAVSRQNRAIATELRALVSDVDEIEAMAPAGFGSAWRIGYDAALTDVVERLSRRADELAGGAA